MQKRFYPMKFPPVSGEPSSWCWWAVLRQGGWWLCWHHAAPPPAPVHTRPSPRPVTTETRDSFSEVLSTQHTTINDVGTLVLEGLPIILLGQIMTFWSSRILKNKYFVYMKRLLGCQNTLIANFSLPILQQHYPPNALNTPQPEWSLY